MGRNPTRWRPVILLAVLAMVLAACGDDGGEGTDDTEAPAGTEAPATTEGADTEDSGDDGPILIGGIGPLSEPGAVAGGVDMQWAMELAVADVNEAGGVLGREIELVFEDTQNTPEVAVSVAKKLIEEDQVDAVIGEYHSGAALAAIPEYSAAGMPTIFSETWNDNITGGDPDDPENLPPQPPTVFRIAPTSSYFSSFAVDWLVNGLNVDKIVLIYEATDFGIGSEEALAAQLEGTGATLESVQVELNQPDYTSVLSRVAEEHGDTDVVFLGGVTGDSSYTVTQNAFDVGLVDDDSICFTNFTASQTEAFWAAVPDGSGCAFVYIGPAPAVYNDTTQLVAEAYTAEFGGPPGPWVFESYDSVWLIADAIERAGSTDKAAVVAALEETSYTGSQGTYSFPYGSADTDTPEDKPWLWHQWPEPAISMVQYTETGQKLGDAAIVWPESAQTDGSAYITP